jgi:lysyl-tRNA synthetase class I
VSEERSRQPERADFGSGVEPLCSVCGKPLVIDQDEARGTTAYRCPLGHDEPVADATTPSQLRERVGELGEDS